MPRHWYVRQRTSLPRFDLIVAIKRFVFCVAGTGWVVFILGIIFAGIWVHSMGRVPRAIF